MGLFYDSKAGRMCRVSHAGTAPRGLAAQCARCQEALRLASILAYIAAEDTTGKHDPQWTPSTNLSQCDHRPACFQTLCALQAGGPCDPHHLPSVITLTSFPAAQRTH